ncbi:MAG: hypothetical protein ABIK15_06130 [Pseudomonadota bacterium]
MKLLLITLFVFVLSGTAYSDDKITPFQFSLFSPVQVFDSDYSVYGLRTNLIYGYNRNIYGLDVGCVNNVRNEAKAIQTGLWNTVDQTFKGIQLSPLVNQVGDDSLGLQLAFVMNTAPDNSVFTGVQASIYNTGGIKGIQIGAMNGGQRETWVYRDTGKYAYSKNSNEGSVSGFQLAGWSNICVSASGGQIAPLYNESSVLTGFQVGFYNNAQFTSGLQLGVINTSENLKGVQVGLINYIKNGSIKFLPIVNYGF